MEMLFHSSSPNKRIKTLTPNSNPPSYISKGKSKIQDQTSSPCNHHHKVIINEKELSDCCGICLSEPGNGGGVSRGYINSCNHFFCFVCIMEWAKVESKCPLCKRRFSTIRRPPKPPIFTSDRLVHVPVRDQVYHYTGNSTIGLTDPYLEIKCSVCQGIEDESLLLLCDLCDSAAHTYCVGLGVTVPESDWFCQDCTLLRAEHTESETNADSGVQINFDNSHKILSANEHVCVSDIVQEPCGHAVHKSKSTFSDRSYLMPPSSTNDEISMVSNISRLSSRSLDIAAQCPTKTNARTLRHCRSLHDRIRVLRENWNGFRSGILCFSSSPGDGNISSQKSITCASGRRSVSCLNQQSTAQCGSTGIPATVLMVNLDNGFLADSSKSKELNKWMRIESLERNISPVAHSLIRFTYSEILSATRNFSKGRVLGRGALSCVFKGRVGFLRTTVAIKKLDKEDKESSKAFCRELMIASSLHDPHIVPLVGFCIDAEEGLFLVYKYVSGGSLERFLHEKKRGVKGSPGLPWSARYKIAMGIAEAIEYLHNGTERCVVHRDIKPSNILISSKKTPKLCDFGLASWTPAPSVPFLCKTVKGTFGYLAPEYFQHGKVSDKTDVYAFGVVLLELITGRKPIESKRGPGEENLVLWAKPLLQQGGVEKLLDPQLEFTQKNSKRIARMVQAATACIKNEEARRPGMSEIVTILRGEEPKGLSRKKAISRSNSTVIDSCPQLKRTKSEMTSHFALAMLGVEFEDDDHLYCR